MGTPSGSLGSSFSTRGCFEDLRVDEGSVGAFRFDGMDGIWLLAEVSEDESHFEDWVVVVHVAVRDVEESISDRFLRRWSGSKFKMQIRHLKHI